MIHLHRHLSRCSRSRKTRSTPMPHESSYARKVPFYTLRMEIGDPRPFCHPLDGSRKTPDRLVSSKARRCADSGHSRSRPCGPSFFAFRCLRYRFAGPRRRAEVGHQARSRSLERENRRSRREAALTRPRRFGRAAPGRRSSRRPDEERGPSLRRRAATPRRNGRPPFPRTSSFTGSAPATRRFTSSD